MHRRLQVFPLLAVFALMILGPVALAVDSEKPLAADPNEDLKNLPETQPTSQNAVPTSEPADSDAAASGNGKSGTANPLTPKKLTQAQREKRFFEFLEREFGKHLARKDDWISRALAAVSLSKLPTRTAGDTLLNIIKTDKNDIVRLVAWQAMLSRVNFLHLEHYDEWVAATLAMADKGLFHGSLRVGLFRLLATVPPSEKTKAIFMKAFAETNCLDSEDMTTLDAMGQCLAAWQSGDLVTQLIGKFSTLDDAFRAEYILQKAGSKAPAAVSHIHSGSTEMWKTAQTEYTTWWNSTKDSWKEPTKSEVAKWRAIEPQFIPAPPDPKYINLEDTKWKEELELGGLGLRSFDIVIALDVTGSMGEVIVWLRRDVKKMMQAFALVSREPRIGLEVYRDFGDLQRDEFVTRSIPLTDNADTLVKALSELKAKGGGDIPEAVLEALTEAYAKNPWVGGKESRKIVLLIADAPNHPETEDKLEALVKDKAALGYKLYAAKVTTEYGANDLSTFDTLAKLGEGTAIPVNFPANKGIKGVGELPPKKKNADLSPHELCTIAAALPDDDPGAKILKEILAGVINPQYKNRLEPFSRTVIAYCEDSIPEKRRPWGPFSPPPPVKHEAGPHQPHKPGPPPKPFDPQQ